MSARVRLSALVVNYQSGAFCQRCVESLRAAWAHEGRAPEDLEVVVVDNASPDDQEPWLAPLERAGVRVVRNDRNAGYAAGMNRALVETRGASSDVVAVLNPDLFFLPGSVGVLLDYLDEHPECGLVGPANFIDDDCVLNLPRNRLPTLAGDAGMLLAQVSPTLARAYSRGRLADTLPWWQATGPFETTMISGCCMFLRRDVIERLPSLMDERYPLYYEDPDLCRGVARLGLSIVYHGGSRVLHHWSRSCGPVGHLDTEPLRWSRISRKAYFSKHYGPLGRLVSDLVQWLVDRWPDAWSYRPMHAIAELGAFEAPVEIPLPRASRFVMELTMAPSWVLTVGIFGEGDRWVCSARTWEWFFEGDYFMRALDLDTGELLGAWHFQKTTPGRNEPLDLSVVPEYADGDASREGVA